MINITSEFQSFDRSNWGPTWVADNIHLGTTSISIDGSVAIIDADLANDAANLHTEALNLPFELWMLTNSDYSIRFKVGSIPDGSTGNLYSEVVLSVTGPTSGPIIGKARISSSATYGKIFLGASSIVKTDWIDGAWYTILLQRFDASATVKIFDDTSGEPVSPQVTLTSDYSWPIDTGAVITVKTDWTQLNPGSTTIYSNGKTWIATQTGPGAPMGTNSGEASLSDGFTDNVHGQFAAGGHVTGSSGLYTFAFAVDLGSSKSVNSASIYWYSAIGFELGRVKYSDTGTSGPWTEIVNSGLANPTNFTFTPASHRYWQITIEHSYVSLTYWAALFSGGDSLVELRISGLPPRYQFYLDNLYAGCVETATVLPTPSAGFGVYTRDRMLLSIRASFTDDNLYNHALVIGTGNTSQVFKSEIKDENSLSPTRIAAIGDRVFKYESDQISTQGAADKAAMKVYLANCLISEDVDLEAICNPAFEGNDVIAVQELTFSELNQKFRIRAFTVPLSTSRQTFKLSRVIAI